MFEAATFGIKSSALSVSWAELLSSVGYHLGLDRITYHCVSVTFTFRTYAIFNLGSRAILIYLGIIGIICIALDIVRLL